MKQTKMTSIYLSLITTLVLLTSCSDLNGLSPEALTATKEAVNRLQKLKLATDVGVNKSEYGRLVIDAQTAVNQALPKLKDGELKNELQAAMKCYAEAIYTWNDNSYGGVFVNKLLSEKWEKAEEHLQRVETLMPK